MARLALTIGGAIAGAAAAYFTGNPEFIQLGMSLGALAGGIIASLVLPGARQYGPRINDLAVMSSAPGQVIPLLWGTMRLGTQIIWSSGLQETSHTQSAKGGPSTTTYTYTVSFAAGVCQGPAVVSRIWGDSKLVYNKGGADTNNRGTWNTSTTYNINDLVSYTDPHDTNSKTATYTYICLVTNIGQVPTNGGFWAVDLVDSSANATKYSIPTVYPGTETQTADPTIVAAEGADLTPAYRGLCYLVWEDFPLADFGNRLPNMRVEVTSNGTTTQSITQIPWTPSGTPPVPNWVVLDPQGATCWSFTGGNASCYIERIDLGSNGVVASGQLDMTTLSNWNGGSGGVVAGCGGVMCVDNDGNLWGFGRVNSIPGMVGIDGWTFKAISFFPFFNTPTSGNNVCNSVVAIQSFVSTQTGRSYIVGYGNQSYASLESSVGYIVFCLDTQAMLGNTFNPLQPQNSYPPLVGMWYWVYPGEQLSPPLWPPGTPPVNPTPPGYYVELIPLQSTPVIDPTTGNCFFLFGAQYYYGGGGGPTDLWIIATVNVLGETTVLDTSLPDGPVFVETVVSTFEPGVGGYPVSAGVGRAMFWNAADGTLIVMTSTGAWLRIQPGSTTILEQVGGAGNPQFYVSGGTISGSWMGNFTGSACVVASMMSGQVLDGILLAPDPDDPAHNTLVVSAVDFTTIETLDPGTFPNAPSGGSAWMGNTGQQSVVYESSTNSVLCVSATKFFVYRIYLDRISTAGLTADIIVADICKLAGLDSTTYNTAALAGTAVEGYVVASLSPAKDMINALGQAFFFEGRESDFVLQFLPRGQNPVLSVPETDLGQARDNTEMQLMLGQEQDVPKSVEIVYVNPFTDYQQGTQKKIRHSRTKKTLNLTSVSLPIVMTASQAAQLAQKMMWTAESQRRAYNTNFWKALYMRLDPCDVIQFAYHGMELVGRVTESTVGQNFVSAIKLGGEDSNSYVSTVTGNEGQFVGQTLTGIVNTLLWMLDLPYLRDVDADATGNTGYYFAMAPSATGTWSAGVLYESANNTTFNQVDSVTTSISYGIAQNVLAAPQSPASWDYTSVLTLKMVQGAAPTGDTPLDVLNGTNVAVLYPSLEIIQFTTVTDNPDGTITLSELLRGRRGTEWACAAHYVGEKVLFPLTGGIKHEQVPLSDINSQLYYKGVTAGQDINAGTTQTVTLVGRDLKPYSPTTPVGQLSAGNWTIGWNRRTRLGGNLADLTGVVPLAEDGQGYQVDILKLVSGNLTVVRSFVVVTNSVTYTAAQQTTDFGSPQTSIQVNVYQISGQVGKGFPSYALINTSIASLPPVDTAPAMSQQELGDIIGSGFTVNGQ